MNGHGEDNNERRLLEIEQEIQERKGQSTGSPTGDGADDPLLNLYLGSRQIESKLPTPIDTRGIDLSKYTPYLGSTVNVLTQDIDELRAQTQSGWEKTYGAIAQGIIGEVGGGTLEGVGYLLDVPAMWGQFTGSEQEWGNWLSDVGKSIKEGVREDIAPIYASRDAGMFSGDWFATNAPSIMSALSLMIPARAASLGLAKLGKLANFGQKLGKTATWTGNTLSTALISRHMENTMESAQVFDQKYQDFLAKGINEEQARKAAGEAASGVYKANYANLIWDIPQYALLLKGPNFANAALQKRLGEVAKVAEEGSDLRKLANIASKRNISESDLATLGLSRANFLSQMGMEGMEEIGQFIISEEGKRRADIIAGEQNDLPESFQGRLSHYFKDPELWTSGFFGALGGGVFAGVGTALEKRATKGRVNEEAAMLRDLESRAKSVIATTTLASQASLNKDYNLLDEIRKTSIAGLGIRAAQSGNIQHEKDMFSGLQQATDEQLADIGFEGDTQTARDFAGEVLADLDYIEGAYNKYADKEFSGLEDSQRANVPVLVKALTTGDYLNRKDRNIIGKLESQISQIESGERIGDAKEVKSLRNLITAKQKNIEKRQEDIDSLLNKKESRDEFFGTLEQEAKARREAEQKAKVQQQEEKRKQELKQTAAREGKTKDDRPISEYDRDEVLSERLRRLSQEEEQAIYGEDVDDNLPFDPVPVESGVTPEEAGFEREEELPPVGEEIGAEDITGPTISSPTGAPVQEEQQEQQIPVAEEIDETEIPVPAVERISPEEARRQTEEAEAVGGETVGDVLREDEAEDLQIEEEREEPDIAGIFSQKQADSVEDQANDEDILSTNQPTSSTEDNSPRVDLETRKKESGKPAPKDSTTKDGIDHSLEHSKKVEERVDPQPEIVEYTGDAVRKFYDSVEDRPTSFNILYGLAYRSMENDGSRVKDQRTLRLAEWLEDPNTDVEGTNVIFELDNFAFVDTGSNEYQAYRRRAPLLFDEETGGWYFEWLGKKIPTNPGRFPIRVTPIDKKGDPIKYKGAFIYSHLHNDNFTSKGRKGRKLDIPADIREQLILDKAAIYIHEATRSQDQRPVSSILVDSTGGVLITDPENKERTPAAAKRNNLKTLLAQVEQQDAKIGIAVGPKDQVLGPIIDSDGNELDGGYEGLNGIVFTVVKRANGDPFPLKLNTRLINRREAELIYDVYHRMARGVINPDSIINLEDRASGIKAKDLLDLLVFEGPRTDKTDAGRADNNRRLYVKDGKLFIGSGVLDPAQMEQRKEDVIKQIINVKRHNVLLGGINKSLFDVVTGVSEFTLFGTTYKKGENDSYNDFILDDGEDLRVTTDLPLRYADGKKVNRLFVNPVVAISSPKIIQSIAEVDPQFVSSTDTESNVTLEDNPLDEEPVDEDDVEDFDPGTMRFRLALEEFPEVEGLIDVEAEREWIKQRLPEGVTVNIIDDIIRIRERGIEAYGAFERGMIHLSRVGPKGTGYHEAFHAVFRGYLDPARRSKLIAYAKTVYPDRPSEGISDVLSLYPDLTDEQRDEIIIEELLAEEFRTFVEAREAGRTYKFGQKEVDSLFKRLWYWIKNIFSNGNLVESLFHDIESGVFRKSEKIDVAPHLVHPAYLRVPGFTPQQVQEVIHGLTYMAMDAAQIQTVGDVSNLDLRVIDQRVKGAVKAYQKKAEDPNLNEAQKKGYQMMAARYQRIADRLYEENGFLRGVIDFLAGMNIRQQEMPDDVDTDQTIEGGDNFEQQDDRGGGLNISLPFEFSGKDTATANIRLFLALQPKIRGIYDGNGNPVTDIKRIIRDERRDPKDRELRKIPVRGEFLKDIPQMHLEGEVWNLLEGILGNTPSAIPTENGIMTGWAAMGKKAAVVSKTNPTVLNIWSKVRSFPPYKKAQFFQAFSKVNYNFTAFLWDSIGSSTVVKIATGDAQSGQKILRREWRDNLLNSKLVKDGKLDEGYAGTLKKVYLDIKKDIPTGKAELDDDVLVDKIERTLKLLGEVGIDINEAVITSHIKKFDGPNYTQKFRRFLSSKSFSYFVNQLDKINPDEISSIPIESESAIKALSVTAVEIIGETYENTVLGPEGKPYWIYSLYSHATQTVDQIRESPFAIDRLLDIDFNSNSYWLTNQLQDEKKRRNFRIATFLNFVEESNISDIGTAARNLRDPDDLFVRFNAVLRGYFPTLNMSDKSTWSFVVGPSAISSNAIVEENEIKGFAENATVYDILTGHILSEFTRMRRVWEETQTLDPSEKIQYFHNRGKNGLKFHFMPELNYNRLQESDPHGLLNFLYNEDGSPKQIEDPALKEALKPAIEQALMRRVNEQIDQLIDLGFLDRKDDGTLKKPKGRSPRFIDDDIARTYYNNAGKDRTAGYIKLISDYVVNNIIAGNEQFMLFHGDPAMYKNIEDIGKRTPAVMAYGRGLDLSQDGVGRHYNISVIQDVVKESGYHKEWLKLAKDVLGDSEQARSILAPYEEVDQADAQGYITMPRYRELMIGLGRWKPEFDEAFDRLHVHGESNIEDVEIFMQPLKGVHFELNQRNGYGIPTYLKYSQAVLIPSMTQGTELDKLRVYMENNDIQETIFNSGVKAGARNPKKAFEKDGTFVGENLTKMQLSNSNWRLQVDLPTKGVYNDPVKSQHKKNIIANILDDMEFTLNGAPVNGRDIRGHVHRAYSALSQHGYDRLAREWDVDPETGKVRNHERFHEMLVEEAIKRGSSDNLIESLELGPDNKFISLLSSSPYRKDIEHTLFSILNKRTKGSSLGGSFVQMSSIGLNKVTPYSELPEDMQKNAKTFEELRPPRFVDGKLQAAQVLLPAWFRDQIPEETRNDPQKLREFLQENREAMLGVAYRIPNQAKASIDAIEVVGFLPDEAGDTIVMYDSVTAKTGSDFDIDKMYVMLKNVRVTEDGKVQAVEFLDEDTDVEQRYNNYVYSNTFDVEVDNLVGRTRESIKKSISRSWDQFKNKVKEAEGEEQRNLKARASERAREIWGEFNQRKVKILAEEAGLPSLEEFKTWDIYRQNGKKAVENRIIDLYHSIFNNDRVFVESITSIDATTNKLRDLVKEIRKDRGYEDPSMDGFNLTSGINQMRLHSVFGEGKKLVGLIANHLTDHALTQDSRISLGYNSNYRLDEREGFDGVLITEYLSALLNGAVDVAKDPWIFDLNMNLFTGNVGMMLLRSGLGADLTFSYLSQPVLRELSEVTSSYESNLIEKRIKGGKKMKPFDIVKERYLRGLKDSREEGERYDFEERDFRGDVRWNDIDTLRSNLREGKKEPTERSEQWWLHQLDALEKFKEHQVTAKALADSILASKNDTVGAGKDIAQAMALYNIKKEVESNDMVRGFGRKFTDTMLGTYYRNTVSKILGLNEITDEKRREGIFSDMFVESQPAFYFGIQTLAANIGRVNISDQDLIRTISDEMFTYLLSRSPISPSPEKRKDYFLGGNTMVDKLKKFKEDDRVKNNLLVRHFSYERGKKKNEPSFIRSNPKGRNKAQIDGLVNSWEELLYHEDKDIRDFAKDLVEYSYISSGMRKGFYTFHDLVPVKYLKEIGFYNFFKDAHARLQSPDYLSGIFHQFFQHNWNDNKIVPIIPHVGKLIPDKKDRKNDKLGLKAFRFRKKLAGDYKVGEDIDGNYIYSPYVKIRQKEGDYYIYKLLGYDSDRNPIYRRQGTRGYRQRGDRIYTYEFDAVERPIKVIEGLEIAYPPTPVAYGIMESIDTLTQFMVPTLQDEDGVDIALDQGDIQDSVRDERKDPPDMNDRLDKPPC